jgi:hypothetical protein
MEIEYRTTAKGLLICRRQAFKSVRRSGINIKQMTTSLHAMLNWTADYCPPFSTRTKSRKDLFLLRLKTLSEFSYWMRMTFINLRGKKKLSRVAWVPETQSNSSCSSSMNILRLSISHVIAPLLREVQTVLQVVNK